ncbi:MAG TPA: cytochrome c [Rubricoccaceae bacterium]|jgi:mono/diheme cytochrome c family protein
MTRPASRAALALLIAATALTGCRGMQSSKPPIHPNLNMDFQQRLEAQEPNAFFADNAAQRQPVAGTVGRGQLQTTGNAPFYYGRDADGAYVPEVPVEVTPALLERGQERFNIYCSVCHGLAGDGRGIVAVGNGGQGYGFAVPSYHTEGLKARPDGYIYDVILNGVNSMPSYGHEMPPSDRWAVVAYVRALQESQDAAPESLPATERERLATYNPNVSIQTGN